MMRKEIKELEGGIVGHIVLKELGNWNMKEKENGMNGNFITILVLYDFDNSRNNRRFDCYSQQCR
jgi:hypothetical protein